VAANWVKDSRGTHHGQPGRCCGDNDERQPKRSVPPSHTSGDEDAARRVRAQVRRTGAILESDVRRIGGVRRFPDILVYNTSLCLTRFELFTPDWPTMSVES